MDNGTTKDYWDSFYDRAHPAYNPSPFAQFIQGRFPNQLNLIDVGCGNGRDAFFFSQHRERVVGIDASTTAIANCDRIKQIRGFRNVEFAVADVDVVQDLQALFGRLGLSSGNCLFYARFFLHAINSETQNVFLDFFAARMTPNCIMCLEFRTAEDQDGYKVFGDHYRRFIDPHRLSSQAAQRNLKTEYFNHGKGLAVYGAEDPYIARLVFSRPSSS